MKAILDQFWVNDGTAEAIQILELEGWLDVVEGLSEARFRKVWAEYQKIGQRTKAGRLYKPDAGAFYLISKKMDPVVTIIRDPIPEMKEVISPLTEQQIADTERIIKELKHKSRMHRSKPRFIMPRQNNSGNGSNN